MSIIIVGSGTAYVVVGGDDVAAADVYDAAVTAAWGATAAIVVAHIMVAIIDIVGDAGNTTTFGVENWIGFYFPL